MKKLASLVLALVLVLSCLSALADYTGTSPVFEEPTTISILTCNGGTKRTDFETMTWWQEVLKRANVDLKLEIIDDSTYGDVAQPRLTAAQDLPDIVKISGSETALAKSNVFLPLNELLEDYGYNINKYFEKYPNVKAALTMEDGNIYYIPYFYTTESNSRTLMINTQFLAALDMTMDDIKTVDDWYDYLVAVKENDVNGNGDPDDEIPLFMRSGMINLIAMYWGLDIENTNGYPTDADGNVFCAYITDEYREFLEFVNKLYTEGLLYNEFLSANYDMQTAAFSENKVGSIVHFVSNCTDYSMDINSGWDFYNDEPIMQILALENKDGNPVVYGRGVIGPKFGITANSKDPEAAMKFLDYMYSDEVGILTWYGIEGTEYELVDGEYKFNKIYFDSNYTDDCGYNMDALAGTQYDYAAKQCETIFKQIHAVAPYTWNPTRVDKYYTTEQQEVLTTYRTDLNTYFKENYTAFMIGTRSLDEWDAYVAGAYEMGVQAVIDVYQEAEG